MSTKPAAEARAALAATAALLGMSVGVDIQPTSAMTIELEAFTIGADQLRMGVNQLKIDGFDHLQFERQQPGPSGRGIPVERLGLNAGDLDRGGLTFQGKPDIASSLRFESGDCEVDLAKYLYVIPFSISEEHPYLIPFSAFPVDPASGQPVVSFLTIGVDSVSYDITDKGISITNVVPRSVPEPAALLLLGSGLAASPGSKSN